MRRIKTECQWTLILISVWTSTWGWTPPPVHMRPPEPDPPPCGRHKWMAPNPVNICRGDDSDMVSFVFSELLTFLKAFKTNCTLPDKGHGINSLYLWQKCFQFSVNFYVTAFQ